MNSGYLVEKEEETSGCLTTVHTFGLADVAAVAVAHRSVALHLSNAAAVAVAHGSVALNLSDAAVRLRTVPLLSTFPTVEPLPLRSVCASEGVANISRPMMNASVNVQCLICLEVLMNCFVVEGL